ncbi:hypothetical protein CRENBAI_006032, partial [Crenichthys baileyi]
PLQLPPALFCRSTPGFLRQHLTAGKKRFKLKQPNKKLSGRPAHVFPPEGDGGNHAMEEGFGGRGEANFSGVRPLHPHQHKSAAANFSSPVFGFQKSCCSSAPLMSPKFLLLFRHGKSPFLQGTAAASNPQSQGPPGVGFCWCEQFPVLSLLPQQFPDCAAVLAVPPGLNKPRKSFPGGPFGGGLPPFFPACSGGPVWEGCLPRPQILKNLLFFSSGGGSQKSKPDTPQPDPRPVSHSLGKNFYSTAPTLSPPQTPSTPPGKGRRKKGGALGSSHGGPPDAPALLLKGAPEGPRGRAPASLKTMRVLTTPLASR